MNSQTIIAHVRRWIETMVIGLNLCPFARRVYDGEKIRYLVSEARDEPALLRDLIAELKYLSTIDPNLCETTILIHPEVLTDFFKYNDFLDRAEFELGELGLTGVIQIASFHPQYQFADQPPDAVENYTNRSPYPLLHLLREASISAIAEHDTGLADIPIRNAETLRRLGRAKILAMLEEMR